MPCVNAHLAWPSTARVVELLIHAPVGSTMTHAPPSVACFGAVHATGVWRIRVASTDNAYDGSSGIDDDDDDSVAPRLAAQRKRPRATPHDVVRARHSSPPRLVMASHDDDGDDDDGEAPTRATADAPQRRARRRPRVEHVSTPPTAVPSDPDRDDSAVPKDAGKKDGKANRAKAKRSAERSAHLPVELLGIVLLASTVLSVLALVSYASGDTAAGRVNPVHNWIGPGGAFAADLMTLALGCGALVVPLGLAVGVALCFLPVRQPRHAVLRIVGGAAAALAMLTLLHLLLSPAAGLPFPPGGLLGAWLANTASSFIAPLGAGVVASAVVFVGALLAIDKPIGTTTRTLGEKCAQWYRHGKEQLDVWREERRLLAHEEDRLRDNIDLDAEREDKAREREANKQRIADKANERAKRKIVHADDQARIAALDAFDHKAVDVANVGPSAPPIAARAAATASVQTQSAPGTEVSPITSDPPWVLDEPVVDGSALSLANVLKKRPALSEVDDGAMVIHERAPVDQQAVVSATDAVAHEPRAAFMLPPLNLLDYDAPPPQALDEAKMRMQADKLVAKFLDFGIEGRVREIRPGPVCTTYELVPAPGIKVSKIAALADDIAMAMEAIHVRIVAPIPGKGAVGIEIPNERRETVYMKEIIADPQFRGDASKTKNDKLMMALGKDIDGKNYYANLADMPHVLISGTTGSGKSVSVNAMICSILYRATPQDVRFLMIDPKMLELSIYEGIPHLLLPPIIDSKKAAVALRWAVQEMERRYQLLSELGVRDMAGFNQKVADVLDGKDPQAKAAMHAALKDKPIEKLPYIVIVIDEYADLLAVAGKDVEGYVMRIAQKARAAGLHVMLATQRPSVDVITGVIKANFPVRMGFRLASNHDSKTIINRPGAEKLLGRGDMLFMPPGTSNVVRVHGAFISEKELHRVVEHLKQQAKPTYDMDILTVAEEGSEGSDDAMGAVDEPKDARYDEAVAVVARTKKCSTSWLQRMMNLGYQRAARIVDRMERDGHVGPALNAKGDREIYVKPDQLAPTPV